MAFARVRPASITFVLSVPSEDYFHSLMMFYFVLAEDEDVVRIAQDSFEARLILSWKCSGALEMLKGSLLKQKHPIGVMHVVKRPRGGSASSLIHLGEGYVAWGELAVFSGKCSAFGELIFPGQESYPGRVATDSVYYGYRV